MIGRKIIVTCLLLLVTTLCFSSPGSVSASSFPDVPTHHRAYDEIMYLANKKILGGYTNGTFKPDNHVTRSEAASMIGRALQLQGGYRDTEYLDVPKNHFASGYIQDMSNKKILAGYGNGYYGVNDKLTREQMASILTRAWSFPATSGITFTDVPVTSPTFVPINKLATAGVVGGYPGGKFGPKDYIMRADFALMLARALNPNFRGKPAEPKPIAQAQVIADSLNVRTAPDANATRIGSYVNGTNVNVYSKLSNGWAYVSANNLKGYVHGAYLKYPSVTVPSDPSSPSNPLKGKIIVVDAGHGAHDPGASGFGLKEKDITLITAKHLRDYLKAAGATVVMTRETDVFHELEKRVSIANLAGGQAFVSVHTNSFNGTAHGTETYYNEDNNMAAYNKKLATYIQTRMMVPELDMKDRGVKEDNFYVIKNQRNMASTLVELGFIDHKDDSAKLGSDTWRKKAAYQIHLGIKDYFQYLQNK
ncbi:N-acetylmuramoyl-L-alanine amidase [Fictibacillus phosphorivorans]|uniref:N-acetylmuramoyl-L-alanine amidase n=1 Tax=Fictibacillus phosphorivorans TaxID=1221500 RepID=UPI00203FC2FE|nr:N-acetylmuramoyl-L-alanine amidase [Fictibacillus phosphorivorans]MCM3718521.1 N-acetylmuramoyl-L-alanine amidase [Fictibacillus phosphorivorans]MCM3776123.1 N-acetylmuramoyl-L-alanine amidase [Fictibacillus phosphorivorans]